MVRRKQLRQEELREAALELEHRVEARWRAVAAAAGAVLVAALAGTGWVFWKQERIEKAGRYLSEGLRCAYPAAGAAEGAPSRTPSYAEALIAFEKAAGLGRQSGPGLAARYSKGAALLHTSRAEEAAPILEEVARSQSAGVLAGSAKALAARAYLAAGQPAKAESLWRELADANSAGFRADMALLELGRTRRSQGKEAEARQAWEELLARFPQSAAAAEARQELQVSAGGLGPR